MAEVIEKRLFVITNATHYLNIRNYIETHAEAENFVVLAIRPYEGYEELQRQIESDRQFKFLQVIFIGKDWNNKLLEYFDIFSRIYRIKKIKKELGTIDKIFFTNYNSWLHHYFVNLFDKAQPVLVSDGTAIFNVAEQRKTTKEIPFSGSQLFKDKVLKLKPIEQLLFYTQMKMNIPDSDSQEVFDFKVSEATEVDENKVFFVGSPLVEAGYLSLEKDIEYLKKVKEKFAGKEFFYFAHRREDTEKLDKYSFFGKVIKDSMPFEERMKQEEAVPKNVVSFVSSVLINLPQVLPQVTFSYYVIDERAIIDKEYQKRYSELINTFRENKTGNFVELK